MSVPMAIYLQDAHPITEAMEIAQFAEESGFHAVWQADSRLVREATVPMAAFAATTNHIKIGSGVIDVWTRNPARLASLFSTLDDLAPGRVLCGLGAWWDPLASKVGINRTKPLAMMRESVTVIRALLANENVTFHGEHVHLDGVELDAVSEPLLTGLGLSCMESCRRVQVTVPSTWTRKECIFISFAWAAWRRTSRRAARLQIWRDAGLPGERGATIRSDGLGIAASKREVLHTYCSLL